LERQYRLDDSIIKFLTVTCDPKLLAEETAREAAAAAHSASAAHAAVGAAAATESIAGG
jgi:hypothetical protein